MRFCDFFMSYKLQLREIPQFIKWKSLPLIRKVAIATIFMCTISILVSAFVFHNKTISNIFSLLMIVTLIVFAIICSSKKNEKEMLENFYSKYSAQRMESFLKLLKDYSIDKSDKDTLTLLIHEAEFSKENNNPLSLIIKPLKVFSATAFPMIAFVVTRIADETQTEQLVLITIQVIIVAICVVAIVIAFIPTIGTLLYRDGAYYDDLISDLKQTIIFYSNNVDHSENNTEDI